MSVICGNGKRHKLHDLICWNFFEGRRCVKHAELAAVKDIQAVIVPLPSNSSSSSKKVETDVEQTADAAANPVAPTPAAAAAAGQDCINLKQDANLHANILQYALSIQQQLSGSFPCTIVSDLSVKPGQHYYRYERLGVPLRLEIGPREFEPAQITISVNPGIATAVLAAGSSSSSGSGIVPEVRRILQLYAAAGTCDKCDISAEAAASNQCSPAAAAAALAAGIQPLKLTHIPIKECKQICITLLLAAASQQQQQQAAQHVDQGRNAAAVANNSCSSSSSKWPRLLPYGCCNKLHLWPDRAPNSSSSSSSSGRPCMTHTRYLLGLGKPCFCGAAPHVTGKDLTEEITCQLTAVSAAIPFKILPPAAAATAAAAAKIGSPSTPTDTSIHESVGIFVNGIPSHFAAAAVRQQLSVEFERIGVVTNVTVPAVGRRTRGWARVMMQGVDAAQAVIHTLDGHLVLQGHSTPLTLSYCCGRADALFPDLPFQIRQQLRIDPVAAYSMTDSTTAAAMAALLAAVAAAVRGWQQQQLLHDLAAAAAAAGSSNPGSITDKKNVDHYCIATGGSSSSGGSSNKSGSSSSTSSDRVLLSVADLTACAGGNAIALMRYFDYVTAVELDPDRAEDLLHNISVVLHHHNHQQQQQQQQQEEEADGGHLVSSFCRTPAAAAAAAAAGSTAFDPESVPHLALLEFRQQQCSSRHRKQQQQQQHCPPTCFEQQRQQYCPVTHFEQRQRPQPGVTTHHQLQQLAASQCLQQQQQQTSPEQQQQQQQCGQVAVVCGNAVQLLPHLNYQDVVFLDPPWGGPNYKQQQQPRGDCTGRVSSSGSSSSKSSAEQKSHNSSTAAAAATNPTAAAAAAGCAEISLGGIALTEFCIPLLHHCYILALKLPSRWTHLDQFCKSVLHNVCCFQQQQQGSSAGSSVSEMIAVRARYGCSELVLFCKVPVEYTELVEVQEGDVTRQIPQQQQQQDNQQQQHEPPLQHVSCKLKQQGRLKQLRQLLTEHRQHNARIYHCP